MFCSGTLAVSVLWGLTFEHGGLSVLPLSESWVSLLSASGARAAKEYQVYWNYPSEAVIPIPTYGVLIDHADGLSASVAVFEIPAVEAVAEVVT